MPPRANPSEKSDDEKLLIAVLSQWNPLPPVDNRKLGEALGIIPGTASVRWHRFKAKLFRNSELKVKQAANDRPGVGQAAAVIDKQKKGGRKRAAAKEGSDEPPAQRKKFDKSIAMSLNAATSKPGPGTGKANKDKRHLDGLDGNVKQENDQFEDGIEWLQIGEDGNELDGLLSGDEA
ncbi:hypothetical protein EAF04_006606 [Stromatinia cepivora]|nr:hypothetical protein EAF04_006606 [Stromatinia cepivora]